MVRLRRVSSRSAGWARVRQGRGFRYLDENGEPLVDVDVERCKRLVIPPAWRDVWICPADNGHLQAVGTDEAGRRQYLYHPAWRERRDQQKFAHMELFARRLLTHRRDARRDLGGDEPTLERVAAAAFSLLDLGMFRIGSERYAEENGSYGLTTIERSHVTPHGRGLDISYVAKSGQLVAVTVRDDRVVDLLVALRRRRSGDRLLAYRCGAHWHDLSAEELNAYIKERLGGEFSAKDFRTWRGTVVGALELARSDARTPTARKRAAAAAMREVAQHLGNTPAVARSSYVDPRVVDLFEDGITVAPSHRRVSPGAPVSRKLERDVLRLLRHT